MRKTHKHSGFTLIEISIVLVIIGLIIGGVLVGKDLIEAANNRSIVSQLQEYETATKAFKLKYNELPGDMLSASATAFGLNYSVACGGSLCNNDGKLDCMDNAKTLYGFMQYECSNYWTELGESKLIKGRYDSTYGGNNVGVAFPAMNYTDRFGIIAVDGSGITSGNGIWLIAGAGNGTYQFSTYFRNSSNTVLQPMLLPASAFSVDQKMDDGVPTTGKLRALKIDNNPAGFPAGQYFVNDDNGSWTTAAHIDTCLNAVSGTAYNISNTTRQCTIGYKIY